MERRDEKGQVTMADAIRTHRLTKYYGQRKVVDNLDLRIATMPVPLAHASGNPRRSCWGQNNRSTPRSL